jgi:hypothetical protein
VFQNTTQWPSNTFVVTKVWFGVCESRRTNLARAFHESKTVLWTAAKLQQPAVYPFVVMSARLARLRLSAWSTLAMAVKFQLDEFSFCDSDLDNLLSEVKLLANEVWVFSFAARSSCSNLFLLLYWLRVHFLSLLLSFSLLQFHPVGAPAERTRSRGSDSSNTRASTRATRTRERLFATAAHSHWDCHCGNHRTEVCMQLEMHFVLFCFQFVAHFLRICFVDVFSISHFVGITSGLCSCLRNW